MDHHALETACKIIRQADREHPADSVLRETFKRLRVFNAEETRAISTGVFTSVVTLVRYTGLSECTVRTLPAPAETPRHHLALQPGHRRGADQTRRPAARSVAPANPAAPYFGRRQA